MPFIVGGDPRNTPARGVFVIAVAWSMFTGCGARQSTANTAQPGATEPSNTSDRGDLPPRAKDAEADAAYYRARAAALAKEAPEEIERTDFRRLRRGRLYERDATDPQAVRSLEERLGEAFGKKDFTGVIETTAAILANDQADIRSHMLRSVALEELKRAAEADFHRAVAVGLIESIMRTGDGRATASAWTVFRVKEEYEILKVLGCIAEGQALMSEGERKFDRLEARRLKGGETAQLYFDITESFAERTRNLAERMRNRAGH